MEGSLAEYYTGWVDRNEPIGMVTLVWEMLGAQSLTFSAPPGQ